MFTSELLSGAEINCSADHIGALEHRAREPSGMR